MEKLRAVLFSIIILSVSSRPVLQIGENDVNNDVNNSISIVNTNELKIGFDLVLSCVTFLIVVSVFGLHQKYKKLFLQISTSLINLRCQVSNMATRRESQQDQGLSIQWTFKLF